MLVWVLVLASPVISGPSPEYLTLLDAAKTEGKVAIGGFGFDPEEVMTLEKGFQKRFGFPIKITHDPTHIRDIPPKVIAGGFDVVEVNVAGGIRSWSQSGGWSRSTGRCSTPNFRSWKKSTGGGQPRTSRVSSTSTASLASCITPHW
jgi:hypothetical protein